MHIYFNNLVTMYVVCTTPYRSHLRLVLRKELVTRGIFLVNNLGLQCTDIIYVRVSGHIEWYSWDELCGFI